VWAKSDLLVSLFSSSAIKDSPSQIAQQEGEHVAPLIVLAVSMVVFWIAGQTGLTVFQDPSFVLRAALAVMFLLTASAHWGRRRVDLVRMVPPVFPKPDALVTITGVLELLGAIGLLLPSTGRATCVCLIALLVALFPANLRAAREHLTIAGRPVPGLLPRGLIQLIFIATLIVAASIR
jgi:uncharacterized membrane protein